MKEITQEGRNQWAVWDGWKLIGVYDSKLEALDAKIGWDRRLWPWTSLFDIEQRIAFERTQKEAYWND